MKRLALLTLAAATLVVTQTSSADAQIFVHPHFHHVSRGVSVRVGGLHVGVAPRYRTYHRDILYVDPIVRPAVMPVVRPVVVDPIYRVPAPVVVHEYFGGHWRYNGGTMKLTQVGNRVFGNAYADDGRVSRIEGTATSRVLKFYWTRGGQHGEGVLYSTATGVNGDIVNKVSGDRHSIHMSRL